MLYIGAAIVIGLLVGLVALAILWLARSVGASIEAKTLSLISEYDELLEKKSLELMKEQGREQKEPAIETTVQEIASANTTEQASTSVINVAQRISNTEYRHSEVGQIYHKIREGFICDPQEIFEQLGITEEPFEKGIATKLLEVLSFDQVYELCTLPGNTQYELLMETMPQEFFVLLEDFAKTNDKFDSLNFYNYLKDLVDLEPKQTVVRVAPGALELFEYNIPKNIPVIVDEDICEGIQIEMKNTLYDFCIKTREIG